MPTFYVDHVKRKGPLFQNPEGKTRQFLVDSQRGIAEESKQRILMRLSSVLREPTGRYQSGIEVTPMANDFAVHDNEPYGGWLEGIDRRNSVNGFPGYHTFRIVRRAIERELPVLLRPYVQKMIRNLGG